MTTRVLSLTSLLVLVSSQALCQEVRVDLSVSGRQQQIDGFGTCVSAASSMAEKWWQDLYFDELGANIIRLDLVPTFRSPYSDKGYNSPWFRGAGVEPFAFNFETNANNSPRHYTGPAGKEFETVGAAKYYNGPEGNRARTYVDAADYRKLYGNERAPIAVMGPSIDDNIARAFPASVAARPAALVAAAKSRDPALSRTKLIGSIWSPAPWLKVSSGTTTPSWYGSWPNAAGGTPYPYISLNGNFVGGRLDVSEAPVDEFDDSALPGDPIGPNADSARGKTSALTQFARSTAAYVRKLQNEVGARFYAISIQNELNFETFYNSCTYPLSSHYIKAVRYVRAEFDKYDDLRGIKIMGPEDLLADSTYSLWQYGGGATTVHKNLQYLRDIEASAQSSSDVNFYCIHGYAADGTSSAGADPVGWQRWARGWTSSPASGLPDVVNGFTDYGKKSWMTETSGESSAWLAPSTGFPNEGAYSIALKIHQALTVGRQSAWLYWQLTDGRPMGAETLTDNTSRVNSPKLSAARHFFRTIRAGAWRHDVTVSGSTSLLASAYVHDADNTLTLVVLNTSAQNQEFDIVLPEGVPAPKRFTRYQSSKDAMWQTSTETVPDSRTMRVSLPGFSVVSLVGKNVDPNVNSAGSARLSNLSVRTTLAKDQNLIVGFSMAGGEKQVLVRGVGPGLAPFGVNNFMPDPRIEVFDGQLSIGSNDNWGGGSVLTEAFVSVGAFSLQPTSADAAVILPVSQNRTVHCTARAAGNVILEAYDMGNSSSPRLMNLSARNRVGVSDEDVLIVGFAVAGEGTKDVLIRGVGPKLGSFGVPNVLANPNLTVFDGQTVVAQNEDWQTAVSRDDFVKAGAFTLEGDTLSAALVFTARAGKTYTVHVKGPPGASGDAIAEIYELPM